jgi:6-phosphofructokinase 1
MPYGALKRVGVLTGGGDCPGLNAVIRAVTTHALASGLEVVGVRDGYAGLIHDRTRPLTVADVEAIIDDGGTILGTSNKANPFRYAVGKRPDGSPAFEDRSADALATIQRHRLDALLVVGGDGSMTIADQLARSLKPSGVPVIGVPKTIDNDLHGTDLTFGFLTAVHVATEAIDRLHTTAASHQRVMVVEVMGRNAGWIALYAGVATAASAILIPEVHFDLDRVADLVRRRHARPESAHTIIVVAEGARPRGHEQIVARVDPTSPDPIRLGGVGKFVADSIEKLTGVESRYAVLGHIQRGGSPVAPDRLLGTQFGHHAMEILRQGKASRMVALRGSAGAAGLTDVDLSEPAGKQRTIDPQTNPLVRCARDIGASFGD